MTKRRSLLICAVAIVAASMEGALASDRTAVYARIDRVVLEPNAEAPATIQVWGVFSLADPDDPNAYRAAAKGYLYFTAGEDAAAARREWSDLKSVAGTGQIVAFGSRQQSIPRLRQQTEKPSSPDAYAVNIGVTKVQGMTNYPPIRALLDYRR
ncbi:MAG: hypothetical protein A3H96_06410 [Acidobacteria bacterium RIFCSPLOWO2_02_FULL_67_36]|nr:MAG: hypothetical protein A3H96_06410 [Acidobacteria bacterium RIFCSPLOWO2_02_FULL_67_36]OFW25915.1 MAG: hypothetical protein A3G21_15250 [Acidobacteria bacterium RIFCSPLOWO2_12_FULL_66_21]